MDIIFPFKKKTADSKSKKKMQANRRWNIWTSTHEIIIQRCRLLFCKALNNICREIRNPWQGCFHFCPVCPSPIFSLKLTQIYSMTYLLVKFKTGFFTSKTTAKLTLFLKLVVQKEKKKLKSYCFMLVKVQDFSLFFFPLTSKKTNPECVH